MIGILFWAGIIIIFYIYFGYPVCLWILARLFPRPVKTTNYSPMVSLIIPAYKEADIIESKIMNGLSLNYPREKLEIIVALDGDEDNTKMIVEKFVGKGVILNFSPIRQGKMKAVNRAVESAKGDIIVISDANAYFETDTMTKLISPFSNTDVGAVSGSKRIMSGDSLLGESEGLYWKYESFIKEQETAIGSCTGVSGEIFAFRKALFIPMADDIINDDFFLAMDIIKHGYRVIYCPDAKAVERISISTRDENHRRVRIIAGRYQAIFRSFQYLSISRPKEMWQIISHKFMRPIIPFLMMEVFIVNLLALFWPGPVNQFPLLTLSFPYQWLFLILQILFYGLGLIGNFIQFNGKTGKILYVPTFLINSNFSAMLGFFSYAGGRQTNIWKKAARRNL
jgi:poly-beta-1,6-N-acetyl-D-glucosamine synthase